MRPHSVAFAPDAQWRAFLAGYETGIAHGIDIGRAQANQEWTDVTTLACRTALRGDGLTPAERRQRRAERPGPLYRGPQTPQQIRDEAERSWAALAPDSGSAELDSRGHAA